jgi:hypothetical protein
LEGDSNTKYFHLIASRKYRKTRIFQLQHEDTVIEGEQALKEYITFYYKDLFRPPKISSFSLDESRVENIVKCPKRKMTSSLDPSHLMRFRRQFSKWNTTKHQGPMDFWHNFIRHVGRSLKMS